MHFARLRGKFLAPGMELGGIQHWRLYVLDTLLGALVIFGTLVAIPSIVMLIIQGLWPAVIADVIILGLGAVLWRNHTASLRWRSLGLCTILYLLGATLLYVLGPSSQIFLMITPALGAILLGTRPAIYILLGNSVTLFCVGYFVFPDFQIPGLKADPLAMWLAITLNFAFVNAIITLSTALLLQGLERSFARLTQVEQERLAQERGRRQELEQQVAQATAELVQKNQIAEDATRAKSDFLAAASHDLRQPTHALGMLVARMGQYALDTNMRELHRSLDASARAIHDLLGELMDYSLLDASGQKTDLQAICLDQLLNDLAQTLTPLAADKGLVLRIRPSTLVVSSDLGMLRRILLNVALNAIRYTETGTVLIACRLVDAGRQVSLEVWDSGIGIAPHEQQHIFKEFYQVGNAARDRSQGIGLGLSIVQRSAQLLGHSLVLRSRLGCGSRFSIRVPRALASAPPPLKLRSELQELMHFNGFLVMLIEDDALSRSALTDLLASWGCSVLSFGALAQALTALPQQRVPDFLLSDFRLGGARNGIEAISDLRLAAGHDIPACLISGDMSQTLLSLVKTQKVALLHKPVQPGKLRNLLRHHQ